MPEDVIHYDNTPTVVCVIVPFGTNQVVTIRRNNDPGKGLLGLPGGYHMRGESWQECGAREVLEETGIVVDPAKIDQYGNVVTDSYGNNLIVSKAWWAEGMRLASTPEEVLEVVFLNIQEYHRDPESLQKQFAFPLHWEAVKRYFDEVIERRQAELRRAMRRYG